MVFREQHRRDDDVKEKIECDRAGDAAGEMNQRGHRDPVEGDLRFRKLIELANVARFVFQKALKDESKDRVVSENRYADKVQWQNRDGKAKQNDIDEPCRAQHADTCDPADVDQPGNAVDQFRLDESRARFGFVPGSGFHRD